MATKMKMVNKGGKMVPAFAADGKGKMQKGGGVKPKTAVKKTTEPKFTPPNNKPTQDSTNYYADKASYYTTAARNLSNSDKQASDRALAISRQAVKDKNRQALKSKPGYDNSGFKANYKTGGMVNSNSKITASKKATGKVGGITKAVSKVAVKTTSPKGRVGGVSAAPKTATPKMKMGGSMKKKSC